MITQEQLDLLILALSRRLPNRPIVEICDGLRGNLRELDVQLKTACVDVFGNNVPRIVEIKDVKPILRSIKTMTTKERIDMGKAINNNYINPSGEIKNSGVDNLLLCSLRQSGNLLSWMCEKEFDYLGLIENNLAIEKEKEEEVGC